MYTLICRQESNHAKRLNVSFFFYFFLFKINDGVLRVYQTIFGRRRRVVNNKLGSSLILFSPRAAVAEDCCRWSTDRWLISSCCTIWILRGSLKSARNRCCGKRIRASYGRSHLKTHATRVVQPLKDSVDVVSVFGSTRLPYVYTNIGFSPLPRESTWQHARSAKELDPARIIL